MQFSLENYGKCPNRQCELEKALLTLPIVLSKKKKRLKEIIFCSSKEKVKYECRTNSLTMFIDPGVGSKCCPPIVKTAVP